MRKDPHCTWAQRIEKAPYAALFNWMTKFVHFSRLFQLSAPEQLGRRVNSAAGLLFLRISIIAVRWESVWLNGRERGLAKLAVARKVAQSQSGTRWYWINVQILLNCLTGCGSSRQNGLWPVG